MGILHVGYPTCWRVATTAVTLAHDLARRGHAVALVDLDAQGNLAPCLGLKPAPAQEGGKTLPNSRARRPRPYGPALPAGRHDH